MQNKLIDVLGVVVFPSGDVIPFGKYKPFINRMDEEDYHITAFKKRFEKNSEMKQLNIESLDNFLTKLPYLVSKGLFIALNQTDGTFSKGCETLLVTAPLHLTDNQIEQIKMLETELCSFDNSLCYVNIIDNDEVCVDKLEEMKDYYDKYINPIIKIEPQKI